MTITISGTAGNNYNITTTDTATNTGSKEVNHLSETIIRSVTYTNSAKSIAYSGTVGVTAAVVDLSALDDFAGGDEKIYLQDNTAPIALTSLQVLNVHNKGTSGNVILKPAASESLLTTSEQISIEPGASWQGVYGTAKTITSDTNDKFNIEASSGSVSCEIYILGA